jgi:hypothetical protein
LFHITVCQFIQYALYKRKAIIRQQTDEEQINADLNVLRIKREAVDAEVEVKVADEDAKNVPHLSMTNNVQVFHQM